MSARPPGPGHGAVEIVAEPEQRLFPRIGFGAVAAVTAGLIAGTWDDPGIEPAMREGIALFGSAVVLAFAFAAWSLGRPFGGIFLHRDPAGGHLGLGVSSPDDTWWLPMRDVVNVVLERRAVTEGRLDVALLQLADRAPVLLAEAPDDDDVVFEVAHELARDLGLSVEDRRADDESPEPNDKPVADRSPIRVRVRGASAQRGVLLVLGLALTAAGVALFSQLETLLVLGLFVGSFVALFGLALLGVVAARELGHQDLGVSGDTWTWRFSVGRRALARDTVQASPPRWRLRIQPLRGASLELPAGDRPLVVGATTTTRSRVSIDELSRLGAHLADARPALPDGAPESGRASHSGG